MTLSIHKQAVDFSLTSTSSQIFTLHKDLRHKACILFFYSGDFNASCAKEICEFKDKYTLFKQYGVEIIGISQDDIVTHLAFKSKYDLPFELLSDPNAEVSELYQALFPVFKFSKRTTYLLNKQHMIIAVYENLFESKKHVQYMLEKLKELQSASIAL
jgi:peroxiredoxin Q/BCP